MISANPPLQRLHRSSTFVQSGPLAGQIVHTVYLSKDSDPAGRIQPYLLTGDSGIVPYEKHPLNQLGLEPHPEILRTPSCILEIPGGVLVANRYDGHQTGHDLPFTDETAIAQAFELHGPTDAAEAVFFETLVLSLGCLALQDYTGIIDLRGLSAIRRSNIKRLLAYFALNGLDSMRVPSSAWAELTHRANVTHVMEPLTHAQQGQCMTFVAPYRHGGIQRLPETCVPVQFEAYVEPSRFGGLIIFDTPMLTDELAEHVLSLWLGGKPGVYRPLAMSLHLQTLQKSRNLTYLWTARHAGDVKQKLASLSDPELGNPDGHLWATLFAVAHVRDTQSPRGRYLERIKEMYRRARAVALEAHEPANKRILIGFLHYLAQHRDRVGTKDYHNVHEVQEAINAYWGANYARNYISMVLRQMDVFTGKIKRSVIADRKDNQPSGKCGAYVLGVDAIRAWCERFAIDCPLDETPAMAQAPTTQAGDVLDEAINASKRKAEQSTTGHQPTDSTATN